MYFDINNNDDEQKENLKNIQEINELEQNYNKLQEKNILLQQSSNNKNDEINKLKKEINE